MIWKKFTFLTLIFLTFIATGLMLSSVQSREADLLLQAHGLDNNSRYFYPKSSDTISDFLTKITQKYPKQKFQIHFIDQKNKNITLVWSNQNLQALPTEEGRYFTQDDFNGQVSFAVLGPRTQKNVIKVQDNTYYLTKGRYYSVIGEFKKYHQVDQKMVYLTTGVKQATAKTPLSNYKLVVDTINRTSLKKIAKTYHAQLKVPTFVKEHQIYYRFSVIKEIAILILIWIFAMIMGSFIAIVQINQVKQTHLTGDLLKNWVLNRSLRLILVEIGLTLLATVLLRWRAFFNKPDHLLLLLGINLTATIFAYVTTLIHLYRKESQDA